MEGKINVEGMPEGHFIDLAKILVDDLDRENTGIPNAEALIARIRELIDGELCDSQLTVLNEIIEARARIVKSWQDARITFPNCS